MTAVYIKNEIQPLWLIKLGTIFDENKTWQKCDRCYWCNLCQKWNWAVVIDQIGCDLLQKNREHNDMTDHIGVTYVKNETKLSWPIGIGAKCDENHIGQQRDWSYRCGPSCKRDLCSKQNWVIMTNQSGCHLLRKLDRTTTWSIILVQSTLNTILNYRDWSNRVPTMKKTI